MPVSVNYREYVLEQLAVAGAVTPRKMFGGVGLYLNGLFFALIADDRLYFKVDDTTRADYERRGMTPFQPFEHRPFTMRYYEVPVEILEEGGELCLWVKQALAVAARQPAKAPRVKKSRATRHGSASGT